MHYAVVPYGVVCISLRKQYCHSKVQNVVYFNQAKDP